MKKRVLCLMADGFEETELVTPVNVLRRAGVEVVIGAWQDGPRTSRGGIRMLPDVTLDAVKPEDFDLLLIPGGPGVLKLLEDGRAAQLAAVYRAAGKPVAAICAAPLILKDAGLLDGRAFTAHASVHDNLPGVTDERVIVDDGIITSRGPGTALDFGLALVRLLAGETAAAEVASEIMA
jgi:4-methyl-5(b-hydroxyethyl)-thiazole monophosphate biosynthesis